jgi:exosortase
LAAAALAVLVLAGLYAAVLDWSHALVALLLATSLALLIGAGVVAGADERVRLIPFSWTSAAAAFLWPLCAPIPPGTYSRLTASLQLWVSTEVVHALHLLGLAAFRAGNIIELAHTRVGVEEACSGVRSLISCIFAGLFFSASLVTRPWARVVIIVLAPLLALAMNFIRSLTLTLMADRGIAIEGFWHNVTGFAVLGVTAASLGALAIALGRNRADKVPPDRSVAAAGPALSGLRLLAVALGLAAIVLVFFYANTRPFRERAGQGTPDLAALLPRAADGWQVSTRDDLYQFRDILQTDVLAERTYRRGFGADGTEIILYLAYWRPGQAPVSLVSAHTPDACWPGAGWVQEPMPESVGMAGPPAGAEGRLFVNSGYPQYVWFWHLYAGRPIPYQDPYALSRLLSIAWHYGFRHNGDQLFVRASSNRPWAEIAREPIIQRFFAGLQPLGL